MSSDCQIETVFRQYFPESTIKPISLEEIPEEPLLDFERKSKQFIDKKDYVPGNFRRLFRISHADLSSTYVVTQTKTYTTIYNDTELLAYLVDISDDSEIQGFGELRYNPFRQDDFFRDKPFVGYTETLEKYRKKGLGTRRLKIMNALSQSLYGLPLHSDVSLIGEAEAVWKGLVRGGVADKLEEIGKNRYFFLTK